MRVRRDVSSVPLRSASETWQHIVSLITGTGSKDVQQLRDAEGVMASVITDEHPARRAIILEGVGAQLRIYCRYGMNAIGEGGSVDAVTWNPTAGEWTMHVPCDDENIDWVKKSLAKTSPRIVVFDVAGADKAEEEEVSAASKGSGILVDWNIKGEL
jgi:hypothetical protein